MKAKDEQKAIREEQTKIFNARIGKNLRLLRESKHWTQENMVDAMNRNYQSDYSRLESGIKRLTLEEAIKIADILEVPIQKIYDINYKEGNDVSSTAGDEPEIYTARKKSQLQLTFSVDGDSATLEKQLHLLKKVNHILQQEYLENS
jgi:transcriptional regulator with XRE-family HTH domain